MPAKPDGDGQPKRKMNHDEESAAHEDVMYDNGCTARALLSRSPLPKLIGPDGTADTDPCLPETILRERGGPFVDRLR